MWVLPSPLNSLWSRKIDWYMNFQITRGLQHQSGSRSKHLEEILSRVAWKLPGEFNTEQDPLLIAVGPRLPCTWLLILEDFVADKKSFGRALPVLSKVWSDLKEPRLRLFAPLDFSKEMMVDLWKKNDLPEDFEFLFE